MTHAEFLRQLEQSIGVPPDRINNDILLVNIPDWDSLSALKFLLLMQRTFGLVIEGQKVAGIKTVGDLVALAADHLTD